MTEVVLPISPTLNYVTHTDKGAKRGLSDKTDVILHAHLFLFLSRCGILRGLNCRFHMLRTKSCKRFPLEGLAAFTVWSRPDLCESLE